MQLKTRKEKKKKKEEEKQPTNSLMGKAKNAFLVSPAQFQKIGYINLWVCA